MFVQICRTVDWPVVGDLLYRLNVNRFMVRKMALGHVYADSSSLSEARFEEKMAVTRASGARHSSIRFKGMPEANGYRYLCPRLCQIAGEKYA